MIKPEKLNIGDTAALVSLSSGAFGEEKNKERLKRTVKNLENIFGLKIVIMPNALIGKQNVYEHPELRAKDLMDAFKDDTVKAIFSLTGGDDTIRILPYIDFDVIRDNPKIFMGYSDTTVNHFMMYKAGITSFYGPAAGVEFSGEFVFQENIDTVMKTLFNPSSNIELKPYSVLADDPEDWSQSIKIKENKKGYETIQGTGTVTGELLGGCLDTFIMVNGTSIWPTAEEWKNKILFIETSEDRPPPDYVKYTFYNLGAQGILKNINGILIGRPKNGKYYDEYNKVIKEVSKIFGRENLPIISNCHFGHAWLWNILPFGIKISLDLDNKKLTLIESPVKESNSVEEK